MKANQNDIRFLETDYIYRYTKPDLSGSGSASLLAMTEEECKEVEKRKIPVGFAAKEQKPKRSRKR